jgi:6-phosphogluconolactonase/glucosamine-6-phosphate isomerase/deaminase
VHLWYGDERCVPLDDPEANHSLATTHLQAP